MTAPRQILPEQCYLITRRCTQRQFLLRPDEVTNEAFRYCLAEAAERFGIQLVAWTLMSNHYHAVVYDPNMEVPEFIAHLHKMLAKVMNARWGRRENLWAAEQASVVRLMEPEDLFDKVVYVLANPIASHLVDRVSDWPGESSAQRMDGSPVVVQRPSTFFRADGTMPEQVTLVATLPPGLREDGQAWRDRVRAAVLRRENDARQERIDKSLRIVGIREVLSASHLDTPTTIEPHRKFRPAIACGRRELRIQALAALRYFRSVYAAALDVLFNGKHAIFPAGTYLLRLRGNDCEPYPSASG